MLRYTYIISLSVKWRFVWVTSCGNLKFNDNYYENRQDWNQWKRENIVNNYGERRLKKQINKGKKIALFWAVPQSDQ